jgi:hypothetical protein
MAVGTRSFAKDYNRPLSKLFNKDDMFGKFKNLNISQISNLLLL